MIEGRGASSEQETPLSLPFKRAEDKKEQHSSTCLDQEHGVQQWLALGGRVVRGVWFASRERPHHPRSSLGRDACTPKQLLMTNQPWVSVLPPLLFCEMTQLRSLTITQTSLTSFPPSISQLTALRILQLSSNKLTALPNFIGRLSSLEQLYCNNNHLASLPCAVSRLTSLQILFLDDNQLTSLPFELASMPCTRGPLSFSVARNRFFCSQVVTSVSVPSLIELCCGIVSNCLEPEARLLREANLPHELVQKMHTEARLCTACHRHYFGSGLVQRYCPSRLASQDVVLETNFCSSRCASYVSVVQPELRMVEEVPEMGSLPLAGGREKRARQEINQEWA